MPPATLIELGRAEARSYGAEILRDSVISVSGETGNFGVSLAGGSTLTARRILIATGLTDILPDIPGVEELWGDTVIHCPYCHGWEFRDQEIAVIATSPNSLHQAHLFRQLSAKTRVVLHDFRPDGEGTRRLEAGDITVLEGPVIELEAERDGKLTGLRLTGDRRVQATAAVVSPQMFARTPFLVDLGLTPVSQHGGMVELIETDNTGATSVPGVYAAGNVTDASANVIAAASQGTFAGAQINANLVDEELK